MFPVSFLHRDSWVAGRVQFSVFSLKHKLDKLVINRRTRSFRSFICLSQQVFCHEMCWRWLLQGLAVKPGVSARNLSWFKNTQNALFCGLWVQQQRDGELLSEETATGRGSIHLEHLNHDKLLGSLWVQEIMLMMILHLLLTSRL